MKEKIPDLKDLVICYKCQTLQRRKRLSKGEVAKCARCDTFLYREYSDLKYRIFAFSLSGIIFFLIANFFPLVSINISSFGNSLNLFEAIFTMYHDGFVLISFFSLLVLLIFPLFLMLLLFTFSLLLILKTSKNLAKKILILLGYVKPWSMLDIFFVALLVAMVKIFDYASIEFGVAFVSMGIFIVIEIYLMYHIRIEMLWDDWEVEYR